MNYELDYLFPSGHMTKSDGVYVAYATTFSFSVIWIIYFWGITKYILLPRTEYYSIKLVISEK